MKTIQIELSDKAFKAINSTLGVKDMTHSMTPLAAENRAARYLAHKQFQKEQRKHRDMDKFMAFTCGLAVCVMVHFLGAL